MPQELALFERFFVRAGRIVTKPWIGRLVSSALIAYAHAMLVKIALVVVVNRLLEQLLALWAVWAQASSGVDRFSFFALDDEGLLRTVLQIQLLFETDAVLFEGLAMILSHVLRQGQA